MLDRVAWVGIIAAAALVAQPRTICGTGLIEATSNRGASGLKFHWQQEQTDFFVTVRLEDGTIRSVRRAPGTKVVLTNPLQAHVDLLDVITDQQMHDLVAYLESLK